MSRTIGENTPQLARSVQGVPFNFYMPYEEGDTVDAKEAQALNQTRCENIKNNVAELVAEAWKKAVEANGGVEEGLSLSAETISQLQETITEYDMQYSFGMPRGGGRSSDPVEQEARDIAAKLVRDALKKKGKKLADYETSELNALVKAALDKYPDIRIRAKSVVAAREEVASGIQLDL